MKDKHTQIKQDKCNYHSMDNDELSDILLRDMELPEGEESDLDEIMYVMEEIVKRKKEKVPSELVDVNAAWESFQQKCNSPGENAGSLQDEKEIGEPIPFKKKQHSRNMKRIALRFACAAAVIFAILFTNTITAYAFGYNLWGAVAEWTKDTFRFRNTGTSIYLNDEVSTIFSENSIDEKLIPTWFPEGYQYEGIETYDIFHATIFRLQYINDDSEIWVTIRKMKKPSPSVFEKDNNEVTAYEAGGVNHYIMTNIDLRLIVWTIQEYECNISGYFSLDDATKMIDSIYHE